MVLPKPKQTKSCLVVSYGPVPTPDFQTVEGGGMRAWGLAKGLLRNGIDVTVAVNESFTQNHSNHEGVKLTNWALNDSFKSLFNSFDAVIVSYCMGDPSVFIVDNIEDGVQLILDCYVPIYVEVSARDSDNISEELSNYTQDVQRFNKALRRGDYFLCANAAQKTFYTGVLSALGVINPMSYRENRILIAPFGIHNDSIKSSTNPYLPLGIKETDFVVLWFGGLYPWFRVDELLDAIKSLSHKNDVKFVFVGGKNPFNPNPDFKRQYDKALAFAHDNKLVNNSVFFVEWVDFDRRIDWYQHANTVISINTPGEENKYSWRTRVMDFVWGEVPIITNGGDPLSDELIEKMAAIKLRALTSRDIEDAILKLYQDRSLTRGIIKEVCALKSKYYWQIIMEPVSRLIDDSSLPYRAERNFRKKYGIYNTDRTGFAQTAYQGSRLTKLMILPGRVLRTARSKGIRQSLGVASGVLRTQVKQQVNRKGPRQFVFISHPMDSTGAPLVLLQIIEEFVEKYGNSRVRLITPGMTNDIEQRVRNLGITVDKAVHGLGLRFIRAQLGLNRDDFVLMNTVAIYDNYSDFIMLWLRNGRLLHAHWFIHEDQAQLPVINKRFLDKSNLKSIHKYVEANKISIYTPSKRTKREYDELLGTNKVRAVPLHVEVDQKYIKPRKETEYEKIDFLLSGTPSDGRKGQMLALAAFQRFYLEYYVKYPSTYRDFTLNLVAIGEDYLSQQIKWVAASFPEKLIKIYPQLPKDEALDITAKCNAVICCSLNETFALYVAEGMFMGHVVLRNDSAGKEEQLREGVNGYHIDSKNVEQFTSIIEKILNKNQLSNKELQKMGKASQLLIESYRKNKYLERLEYGHNTQ